MHRPDHWTRRLLQQGSDPDPRFSFANERTFLAWIRTSLALVAAGIGVDAYATELSEVGRRSLAALLLVLGTALSFTAFRRWHAAERALRLSESLPTNELGKILAYGVGIGAAMALVLIIVR